MRIEMHAERAILKIQSKVANKVDELVYNKLVQLDKKNERRN